jgi:uncharacterized protein with PQ loop repeat
VTFKMEMLGWAGTALVIVAYIPQIRHLYFEKCAWGISVSTWVIWLAASVLLLSYCIFRHEALLGVVQVANLTAIMTTIILVGRSNHICPYHRQIAQAPESHSLSISSELSQRTSGRKVNRARADT